MAKWNVDASHTTVWFTVRHMMITNVRGEFGVVEGSVDWDAATPTAGSVTGSVDVASIDTREPKRDGHLKSADFFDAEQFPKITFASKEIRKGKDGLEVLGDLTMHGTTKPLTIFVDETTGEQKDPWGGSRIGVTAHASVKRSDFGMVWNMALEAGGMLVADEVKMHFDVSLVKAG
ncbi:MAG: YceI family protein [Sandaracinus sp.]